MANRISSVINALRNSDRLSASTTRGIFFMSLRQIIFQLLLVIKILLIARLLGPELLGIFGLIMLLLLLVERFSQTGFELAIIHYEGTEHKTLYNTAWTLNLIRLVFLFIIYLVLIIPIETIFKIEGYSLAFFVIGLTLIIEATVNIGSVNFMKTMRFDQEFIFRVIPDLANIIVTLILTLLWENIWALILGVIAERIVRVILSYSMDSFRPNLLINKEKAKFLLNYGLGIWSLGIISFLGTQNPEILVPLFYGITFLAFYQISNKIATIPVEALQSLISTVTIPTYSKIQADEKATRELFQITLFLLMLIYGIYVMTFIPMMSSFVTIVLGDEWLAVLDLINLLFVGGFLLAISATIDPVFLSHGNHSKLIKPRLLGIVFFLLIGTIVGSQYELKHLIVVLILANLLRVIGELWTLKSIFILSITSFKWDIIKLFVYFLLNFISVNIISSYLSLNSILMLALGGGILIILQIMLFITFAFLVKFQFLDLLLSKFDSNIS